MSWSTTFYTPIADIPKIHKRTRNGFLSGKTKSIEFRKEQIAQVGYLLKDNEQRIKDALKADLGRPALETEFFDFAGVYIDVKTSYENVEKWTKWRRAEFNLNFFPMGPKMHAEPKGVVLVVAPFNFPVYLILSPLVGAIAARCGAVIKPSEQTPTYAALLAELVAKYLDNELYQVINGGVPETTAPMPSFGILPNHDAGNARVARIIARAAAKHLTPLTLEVSPIAKYSTEHDSVAQNPVVIDPKCDLQNAAKRILWGRFSNAGQASHSFSCALFCLAPEYVLVPEEFQDILLDAFEKTYNTFYPDGPEKSDSLSRIVSVAQAERLERLIRQTRGKVVLGGDTKTAERYVAPTVVRDVRFDDPLMENEIFGPILLVVPVKNIEEAVKFINSRGAPLAVYVFSGNKRFQKRVFENTQSGAVVANETGITAGVPGLPMGGVGASGYGYFTGKFIFDQFTHLRVSIDNPSWVDKIGLGFRYPPFKVCSTKQLQALTPSLPPRPSPEAAFGKRRVF
ncbi:NAD-dependent aldehyde dehydrogenase [Trametes meyenii]|nr:NAD-dependent aldehyde dehydrogenase [Trametes meyenii]